MNRQEIRELKFQQKQRLFKLKAILVQLNDWMQSRTFLVGERLTLADTNLAIDMLPLFNISLDGRPLIKEVSPSPLVHLQRWHNTVIHQPRFEAVYHPEAFKEDLISHKDQSSKKTAAAAITSTKKATEK